MHTREAKLEALSYIQNPVLMDRKLDERVAAV